MYGIALSASGDTPDFWRLVDRSAAFEDKPTIRALGYAAHVSLAVYDTIDPAELTAAVEALENEAPLGLRFHRIATFDGKRPVLWLAPEPDLRLTALHAAIHEEIGCDRATPYYRPDAWVPHCTLATAIAPWHRDAALAFAAQPIVPFEIVFDRLDAVAFPPVSILSRATLRS